MGQRKKRVGIQNVCFRLSCELKQELKDKGIDKWEIVLDGVGDLAEIIMNGTDSQKMELMKEVHRYNKQTKRDTTDNLHKVDLHTFWNLTEIARATYSTRSDIIRYILSRE